LNIPDSWDMQLLYEPRILQYFCYKFYTATFFIHSHKLRKASIRSIMTVRPSVCQSVYLWICIEHLGFHWPDFHEILNRRIFLKSVKKIKLSTKSDKKNVYFKWRPKYIFYYVSQILEWDMFQTKVVEIETFILYSVTFFNRAIYEIMWKIL